MGGNLFPRVAFRVFGITTVLIPPTLYAGYGMDEFGSRVKIFKVSFDTGIDWQQDASDDAYVYTGIVFKILGFGVAFSRTKFTEAGYV